MSGQLLTADEIIKTLSTRTWYQLGPGGQRYFYGQPGYHFISGATKVVAGTIDPIYAPDPRRPGRYRLISRTRSAPDLNEFSVDFHESWGGIPRHLINNGCPWTFYELHSRCADPSDFYRGWEGYVMIYSNALFEGGIDLGARTARDADDPLTDAATFKAAAIYPAGTLGFGEEAATDVVVEVIDVVYGQAVTCGDCGAENDGSQHIYALTRANVGSPSAPGQLVYSLDGGLTWTTASITGIGSSAEPRYIDLAGGILFVGTDSTTLFTTTLNPNTGAPTTWGTVTLPVAMTDVYVQSPTAVFFSASGGRVYRTTDITVAPTLLATVGSDNLARIHGSGETIVAVGAAGQVIYSVNNGVTWVDGTNTSANANQALFVTGPRSWWVGDAAGGLFKTTNQGVSYATVALPGATPSAVTDILFATLECAWVAATVSSVGRLFASLDGGATWARDDATSRIVNWPTIAKAGRIAAPFAGGPDIAANYLAVAGLATGGTDGILIAGAPSIV
jgi:hypothetical protein